MNYFAGANASASSNNRNLISQAIAAAGQSFEQSCTYDQFNRVASAAEGSNWARAFGYDRWGNMWVVSGSGVPIDSFAARNASAYNAQNRRVDVGYDAAGNQTTIGGYTWAYDAEGRLKTSTINGATATYYYDAEGRRVKRVLPVGTTVYVYDAGGNLAAEYGYAEPGARCTTCYLTADHLGSTRMLTAQDGNLIVEDPGYIVKSLHDYIPFGEEVQAGVGGRSSTYYVSQPLAINDGTTIKFTGREREGENGAWLDYFGARYYASVQGRFTSPDAPLVDQHVEHPQSWNLYAYVRNNPLRLIDPTGHWAQAEEAERAYDCRVDVVGCKNQSKPRPRARSVSGDRRTTIIHGDGNMEMRHGNIAFRDNNPGNLRPGPFTKAHGQIGVDVTEKSGSFAVFENSVDGEQALRALLATPRVQARSILEEMQKFASANDGNDPAGYAKALADALKVDVNTPMSSLTPAQMDIFVEKVKQVEGFYDPEGSTVRLSGSVRLVE